jgi:hypothetical protein
MRMSGRLRQCRPKPFRLHGSAAEHAPAPPHSLSPRVTARGRPPSPSPFLLAPRHRAAPFPLFAPFLFARAQAHRHPPRSSATPTTVPSHRSRPLLGEITRILAPPLPPPQPHGELRLPRDFRSQFPPLHGQAPTTLLRQPQQLVTGLGAPSHRLRSAPARRVVSSVSPPFPPPTGALHGAPWCPPAEPCHRPAATPPATGRLPRWTRSPGQSPHSYPTIVHGRPPRPMGYGHGPVLGPVLCCSFKLFSI